MSSACDGDAIASSLTKKRRLRHRATGTFVISVYRAPIASPPTIGLKPSPDEDRVACESRGPRPPSPPREKRNGAFASPLRCCQKGRLQRLSGEKIAPKPDKVAVCLATRLHNFPNRESFLRGRHFFLVTPGAALPCASAAVRRAAAASEMDLFLITVSQSGTRSPA
jgi:hypothetical protein